MWALCRGSASIDLVSGARRWIMNPPSVFSSSSTFPHVSSFSLLLHSPIHCSALYPALAVSRARRGREFHPLPPLSPPFSPQVSEHLSISIQLHHATATHLPRGSCLTPLAPSWPHLWLHLCLLLSCFSVTNAKHCARTYIHTVCLMSK